MGGPLDPVRADGRVLQSRRVVRSNEQLLTPLSNLQPLSEPLCACLQDVMSMSSCYSAIALQEVILRLCPCRWPPCWLLAGWLSDCWIVGVLAG